MKKLKINTGGDVTISGSGLINGGDIDISSGGDLSLSANGWIKADGLGNPSEGGSGKGGTAVCPTSWSNSYEDNSGTGGGYGGEGGLSCKKPHSSCSDGTRGASYGMSSASWPIHFGSGGGNMLINAYEVANSGGKGGGRIKIVVAEKLTLSGKVTADGLPGTTQTSGNGYIGTTSWQGGGGSGGSILIDTKTLVGSGAVHVNGGSSSSGSGAGSGGRIAIYIESQGTVTGSVPTVDASVTAYGGSGSSCGGAAGTIFIRHGTLGMLEIDNNGNSGATSAYTPMPTIYSTAEGADNSPTTSTGFKGPLFGTEVKGKARVDFQ
ncbi:hypothetical protein TrVE_jg8400, partial [Triparma verrucosa]